jgi:hypothetical protein
VLLHPVVLEHKALFPIAVLLNPVVLEHKARYPIAVLLHPVVFLLKDPFPAEKLSVPVAEELKFVVAPIEIFVGMFPPPVLISKLLMVPFKPDVEIEPVTPREPVIKAEPVYGNVVSGAYEALKAFVANEAVVAKLELTACKT